MLHTLLLAQEALVSREASVTHTAVLGQANYIYSLASAPACCLASPLQADLCSSNFRGVAHIYGWNKASRLYPVWSMYVCTALTSRMYLIKLPPTRMYFESEADAKL